jgi:hypothetical protein
MLLFLRVFNKFFIFLNSYCLLFWLLFERFTAIRFTIICTLSFFLQIFVLIRTFLYFWMVIFNFFLFVMICISWSLSYNFLLGCPFNRLGFFLSFNLRRNFGRFINFSFRYLLSSTFNYWFSVHYLITFSFQMLIFQLNILIYILNREGLFRNHFTCSTIVASWKMLFKHFLRLNVHWLWNLLISSLIWLFTVMIIFNRR